MQRQVVWVRRAKAARSFSSASAGRSSCSKPGPRVQRQRVIGPDGQCLIAGRNCFVGQAVVQAAAGPRHGGFGNVGVQRESPRAMRESFVGPIKLGQRLAQADMRFGRVGKLIRGVLKRRAVLRPAGPLRAALCGQVQPGVERRVAGRQGPPQRIDGQWYAAGLACQQTQQPLSFDIARQMVQNLAIDLLGLGRTRRTGA